MDKDHRKEKRLRLVQPGLHTKPEPVEKPYHQTSKRKKEHIMKYGKEVVPVIPPKDMVVGDPSAPVTLVEFGDYESTECAQANEAVKQVLEKYDGKVKFIFRHFPLTMIHQKAHK